MLCAGSTKRAGIALLVFQLGRILEVAAQHPDPALARADHRDRLPLDGHLQGIGDRPAGATPSVVRRAPSRPSPNLRARRGQLLLERRAAPGLVAQQDLQMPPLGAQLALLLAQRLLLEPAQIAQAHVEDRLGLPLRQLERAHQLGLGLVLLANDADHLVEVQVGDAEGRQHLEPILDPGETVAAAADQHVHAVREERLQHLDEAHHPRRALGVEHVEIERQAGLELGLAEQLLHQQLGRHGARPRQQHEPHLLGRFVAHVRQQRQPAGREQLGDPLDQARLGHLIGDLAHHDLILAVARGPRAASGRAGAGCRGRGGRPRRRAPRVRPGCRRSADPAP